MAKYQNYQKAKELPRNEIHPVWRGIGCIIMIITPIISGAAAKLMLDFGLAHRWQFLYQLSDRVKFPDIMYKIPGISMLAQKISNTPYFYALAVFFLLLLLAFSGVLAVLNAALYRMIGPPRYTRIDEPAPRVKTKRYTR